MTVAMIVIHRGSSHCGDVANDDGEGCHGDDGAGDDAHVDDVYDGDIDGRALAVTSILIFVSMFCFGELCFSMVFVVMLMMVV